MKLFKFIIVLSFLFTSFSVPKSFAGLDEAFSASSPMDKVANSSGYRVGNLANNTLENRISFIISLALSFLGVIFLALFIYAGYLWMMAQGNEKDVQKAKDIMQRAVIGIIIVVSAYGISYFVISNVSKGQLNNVTDSVAK